MKETEQTSVAASLSATRLILVARRAEPTVLKEALHALKEVGLHHVEVTLDTTDATTLLQDLRDAFPSLIIGAGTVLSQEALTKAVRAGAQFVVSPHGSAALAQAAREQGVPYIPGAYTPSEIMTAWDWRVPLVKVFPVVTLGTAFLRQFRGPCPDIPLIVTGGITLENALEYRQAGATAVGMGSELLRSWQKGNEQDRVELVRQVADLMVALR